MNNQKDICLALDDVVINSSQTVIDILNRKYNLHKTFNDLKDPLFQSIYKGLTEEELISIFNSDEFWNSVKISEDFLNIYNKYKNKYHWIISGDNNYFNVRRQKAFIDKNLGIDYVFCPEPEFISYYIQIDSNSIKIDKTKAKNKIVLTYNVSKPWNKLIYNSDIYFLNDWEDVNNLLKFVELNEWW